MLSIFNRREVYVTQNMKKQAEVRDALAAAGINYTFKVSGRGGPLGGLGMRPLAAGLLAREACSYTFYVHKKDYEWAHSLLQRIGNAGTTA